MRTAGQKARRRGLRRLAVFALTLAVCALTLAGCALTLAGCGIAARHAASAPGPPDPASAPGAAGQVIPAGSSSHAIESAASAGRLSCTGPRRCPPLPRWS